MPEKKYNVLFLCTGNSARSILGEALTNKLGRERFYAYSAGSHPKGEVHPLALEALRALNIPTQRLRSKGWEEFVQPDAPRMDFVFTVCDRAAAEPCPIWPGQPATAHWGIPDPAAVTGSIEQQRRAFLDTLHILDNRIRLLLALRIEGLDRLRLKHALDAIGNSTPEQTP